MKIIIIIDKKKTIKIFLRPTIIMTLTPTHGFTELQLRSSQVLSIIDENTDLKKKKALTWDNAFKNVGIFVVSELDYIENLKTIEKRQKVK